nr:hypothetical protein [Nostoc sp. CmiVER01]
MFFNLGICGGGCGLAQEREAITFVSRHSSSASDVGVAVSCWDIKAIGSIPLFI